MKRINFFSVLAMLAIAGVLAVAGSLASAQQMGQGPMASPMASPMMGGMHMGGTSAAYMVITNNGDAADTLIGGSTDVAEVVEIHDMKIEDGVMSMFQLVDGLDIPAGETVTLKPQSLHVMMIGLQRDLMPGDTFDLTLEFAQAGEVTVTVTVGMGAADDAASFTAGDLVIEGVWARPAPMLGDGMGTPDATPIS